MGIPFQVLAILLERPGEVVAREELQKRLWPDTFVDVERNLNTAVNKIREVLGDSAENPRFVEMLPRRRYRFIGELEAPVPSDDPASVVGSDRIPVPRHVWWKTGAATLGISFIALAVLIAFRWRRPQPSQEPADLTAVPFTALPGNGLFPGFLTRWIQNRFCLEPYRLVTDEWRTVRSGTPAHDTKRSASIAFMGSWSYRTLRNEAMSITANSGISITRRGVAC